jgi:hypothetical protein
MYDSLLNCLLSIRFRYVPLLSTVSNWFNFAEVRYSTVSLEEIGTDIKKSDTIFVIGGSESINEITDGEWRIIEENDSIGMNWWPVHPFAPTYYYTNYPRNPLYLKKYREVLSLHLKKKYQDSVFFISGNRAVRRGIHPRIVPDLFPDNAACYFYKLSSPIQFDPQNEFFTPKMFKKTLFYRGGLSLILDFAVKLGYTKIVLMGIDLKNSVHFYDNYPEMQWQFETGYSMNIETKSKIPHGTMSTKGNSKVSMNEYLYAVNDMFFKPNGVELFVGSDRSTLADRIPIFNFS